MLIAKVSCDMLTVFVQVIVDVHTTLCLKFGGTLGSMLILVQPML